jgi:hypothetical protein
MVMDDLLYTPTIAHTHTYTHVRRRSCARARVGRFLIIQASVITIIIRGDNRRHAKPGFYVPMWLRPRVRIIVLFTAESLAFFIFCR